MPDILSASLYTVDGSGNVVLGLANANMVVLLNGTVTYTPNAKTKAIIAEAIAGGGAGGACATTVAGQVSIAGGGGGGGAAISLVQAPFTNPAPPIPCTIGAGGVGGGGAGPAGGNTSLGAAIPGPFYVSARGGNGGAVGNVSAAPPFVPPAPGIGGSDIGIGAVGNTTMKGGAGIYGFCYTAPVCFGSAGGNAAKGGGITLAQVVGLSAALAGLTGSFPGGGGGGAVSSTGGGSLAGGSGANGVLIITEILGL